MEMNNSELVVKEKRKVLEEYGAAKDLSDIIRRNQEYTELAEIHSLLINNSLDIITRTDSEGKILYISPACYQLLGYTEEELIGSASINLIHKEDFKKAISNNHATLIYRVRKKDGSYIWMESLCKPILDTQTQVIKEIIGVTRDITQRKIAEEDIKKREDLYSNLVEHSPDAVMIAEDGKILFINQTGVKLLGALNKKQLIGRQVYDFLDPEYHEVVKKRIEQLAKGNTVPFIEQKFRRIDGSKFVAEVKGIPTIYDRKSAVHIIIRDIEERKQTQKLLVEAEKLKIAGQFAAGIAHEVRNPLTAIKGFLQLMEDTIKDNKFYFEIVGSEINRIEMILSELLTLAKPQDLKFKKVNLKVMIEQVKTLIDTQAIMNNIKIITIFQSDTFKVTCDENQLKQVFINLIKNSIEAMLNGGTITIEVKKHCVDKLKLLFIDTGEGIPQHILKRIGEPFLTTKEKGTGLGLMISKQIVENHNGRIHFSSNNNGTIIEIVLPIT